MDVMMEGEIAKRFLSGEEAVRPLIFSHGLSSNSKGYTGLAKDLASHGYLVIMLNHQDGTCMYTETKEGKPMFYQHAPVFYTKDLRINQLNIRIDEVIALIQELTDLTSGSKLYEQLFGAHSPQIKVDMDELIFSGHSFGAMTAV